MKTLGIFMAGGLLLAIFFQCCPSSDLDRATPRPTASAPQREIWTLKGPPELSHGLWGENCLSDEQGADSLGSISGGTQMSPTDGGCHRATWDTGDPEIHPGGPYIYCEVEILDGPLAGKIGWVKEDFIQK